MEEKLVFYGKRRENHRSYGEDAGNWVSVCRRILSFADLKSE